jgi:DnaK suppressor protein
MSNTLDNTFLESQRRHLLTLREQLQRSSSHARSDERDVRRASDDIAPDTGDEGQRLAMEELDQNLIVRNAERLAQIERALQKIDAGTYGISEVSGQPIARARLEAVPEATRAVDE